MTSHFLNDLRTTFADRAGAVACVHPSRTFSFADLDRCAGNAAAVLQRRGMAPGDRVLLCTPARVPFLIAHLGILFGGGVSLPLNPKFTREELRHFLNDSGAGIAVVGAEQRPVLESLRAECPTLKEIVADTALTEAPAAAWRERTASADDPCLLVYSSGTTGWPKGIVHTHANLAHSLHALGRCWRFTPEDVVVNVLPLFHIHGLSFATHLTLLCGACLLLEDSFHPEHTLDVVGRGTVFMAVPTIYYRFLEQPTFADRALSWSRVRLFTCGSAPIRPDVLPRLEAVLGKPVINRYGMTEAHVITSLPLDGPWPTGSVGLPLSGIELRIARPDGQPAEAGEVGAVFVRGPNLFRTYWGNPEATRKAFATGWFDTGDLGSVDERGFLTLAGRSNDLIITNGYNVYPPVVERVVNGCPGVRESAVVGVPDDRRGERVAAFVVPDDPALDEERLRAFCKERLVDYQCPRQVVFVETLPRNALGKVLRKDLVKQVTGPS
jgi:malonyl-CoA/methylmalonyl-CoA synthetase